MTETQTADEINATVQKLNTAVQELAEMREEIARREQAEADERHRQARADYYAVVRHLSASGDVDLEQALQTIEAAGKTTADVKADLLYRVRYIQALEMLTNPPPITPPTSESINGPAIALHAHRQRLTDEAGVMKKLAKEHPELLADIECPDVDRLLAKAEAKADKEPDSCFQPAKRRHPQQSTARIGV